MSEHPAIEFLTTLFPPGSTVGFVNIRFLHKGKARKKSVFLKLSEIQKKLPSLLKEHRGWDVYFLPALVIKEGSATREDIKLVIGLKYDLDFREAGISEEDVKKIALPNDLRASVKWNTGGGRHGIFLFEKSVTTKDFPRFENLEKRLCQALKADPRVCGVWHTLRLPGTLNHKYTPPREVKLIRLDPGLRYTLDDFECLPLLQEEPKPPKGHTREDLDGEGQRFCYDFFAEKIEGQIRSLGNGEYQARCPFSSRHTHGEDREPSFTFNVQKGVFHCFGCGASGGIKDFSKLTRIPIPKGLPGRLHHSEITEVSGSGLREITPGLDFQNGTAYVAVPHIVIDPEKGRPIHCIEVLTSSRERFRLTEEALLEKGFYTSRNPRPLPRWSKESIEAFLSGENNPSLETLFIRIEAQYQRYIDFLDPRVYSLLAIWTIGTYFHRLFSAYPYIHLNGDPQTGKTKTLELTALITFNGELTFHSTPAYIVRSISDNHCVCCVDEAERLRPSKDEDRQLVITMFNSGYKRGSMAGKVEATGKKGKWEVRRFEAYSPKMFASIKNLDPVLKTRCVPIVMVESCNLELKNRMVNPNPVFQSIRDELYRVMMTHHKPIGELYRRLTDEEIGGREWELWRPLLALALAIDGEPKEDGLYVGLRKFALEVGGEKRRQREQDTSTPKLLLAFQDLLGDQEEGFYPTSELAGTLNRFDDEFFGWMTEDETQKTKGRVGRFLRREVERLAIGKYDKNIRIEGKTVRGYRLSQKAIKDRLKGIGLS